MDIGAELGVVETLVILVAVGYGIYWFEKHKADLPNKQDLTNLTTNQNANIDSNAISQINSISSFPDYIEVWGTGMTVGELHAAGYTDDDIKSMFVTYIQVNPVPSTQVAALKGLIGLGGSSSGW